MVATIVLLKDIFSHTKIKVYDNQNVGEKKTFYPSIEEKVNFSNLAKSCGYEISREKVPFNKISKTIKDCINKSKSSFIEIVCDKGHRNNLSRPNKNLKLRKIKFMKQIKH